MISHGSGGWKAPVDSMPLESPFLVHRRLSSRCVHRWRKGRGSSLLPEDTFPPGGLHPPYPISSPKAPPLETITSGIRIEIENLREHKHSVGQPHLVTHPFPRHREFAEAGTGTDMARGWACSSPDLPCTCCVTLGPTQVFEPPSPPLP